MGTESFRSSDSSSTYVEPTRGPARARPVSRSRHRATFFGWVPKKSAPLPSPDRRFQNIAMERHDNSSYTGARSTHERNQNQTFPPLAGSGKCGSADHLRVTDDGCRNCNRRKPKRGSPQRRPAKAVRFPTRFAIPRGKSIRDVRVRISEFRGRSTPDGFERNDEGGKWKRRLRSALRRNESDSRPSALKADLSERSLRDGSAFNARHRARVGQSLE